METHLFAMNIGKPRDLLRARQRARQLAGLLGFLPDRQALLAAEVFACLRRCHRPGRRTTIAFVASVGRLWIEMAGLRFSTALPEVLANPVEDVAWMMRELERHAPFRIMEEVEAQNRELLAAAQAQPFENAAPLRINESAA